MAGPPRYTTMPPMGNGHFRMNFAPPPLIGMRPPGPLAPSAGGGGPPKNSQVTTVFVGNISEKAENQFVQQMLEMCGQVVAWKRMAGVTGKLQGFGFCDFEEPEDTLRALRVLNEFQLGDKKLIVKVEQKHRDQLKAFAEKEAGVPAKPNSEELPASDKALRKDENVRLKILEAIEKDYPDLVKFEDGELEEKEKEVKSKDAKKESGDVKERKESRRSKRSRSRSGGSRSRSPGRRGERGRRSRSPRNKRRRRSSRSSSRSSSDSRSSRSSSRSSSYDSRDKKKRSRRSRSASRATYASEDSEDAREKRAMKRQIKEKEMAYAARLREWEGREKKMAKKYEKDESREKNRKLDVMKEAKKLKAFLEDYDDEKDDPKYYRSSSLFARRRDFEREKEADERDRLKEQAEIEELKRQILEESKAKVKQEEMETKEVEQEARRRHDLKEAAARAKLQRDGSGSPNPHQPLGQRRRGNEDGSSSSDSGSEEDEEKAEDENDVVREAHQWSSMGAADSPAGSGFTSSPAGGVSSSPAAASSTRSPLITTAPIKLNTLKQSAASVFDGDEDEDDSTIMGRKKLKPFEITQEERIKTMTAGEIKKMQKEIADKIPADKEGLFAFEVKSDHLPGVMGRVKNWVAKKIREYIGEEDQSLIEFIVEKVQAGSSPSQIQDDLSMIIDNDAGAFTIKLWRLVIYETECAAQGLHQAIASTSRG
ncbi:hypothetical protein PFISCL1PPCAC_396 [Pristionchus fissidentatus]|uniref:RNA binding protein n=1 Tax=Pristionchus fissidentatus TaxID=1538716 RepID=A0AAV5UTL9_9BILA|nr:hypothetical protein PFISCL1PPCAC_396 [Pristionchus fissidentatus]